MNRKLLLVSALLVVLGVLGLAPAIASAQQSTTDTTCPGCGPGPNNGDGTKAFAWPEHFCDPTTGRSSFDLIVGLGRRADVPEVIVYVSTPGDPISRPLGTVERGKQRRFKAVYEGNSSTTIAVSLFRPNGTQFPFYSTAGTRIFALVCDCPQPPTTTSPPTTSGPTTTVAPPPSSSPDAPGTTLHDTTSVPGAPTLPETGSDTWLWQLGLLAFAAGALLLVFGRRPERKRES